MAKKAAKKAPKKEVNKTQLIKEALAKSPNGSPSEIAEELKAHGITAQYVSTVKNTLKKKKGTKKVGRKAASKGREGSVNRSDLVRAKKLADELGGVQKAKELLDIIGELT